jgi:hypothetical protein
MQRHPSTRLDSFRRFHPCAEYKMKRDEEVKQRVLQQQRKEFDE